MRDCIAGCVIEEMRPVVELVRDRLGRLLATDESHTPRHQDSLNLGTRHPTPGARHNPIHEVVYVG